MKSHNILFTLLIFITLSVGCKVSKDVLRPAGIAPQSFRNASDTSGNSIGKLKINDFIADPQIRDLIDSAILRNYDLQIALKNVEASALLLSQVKLNVLPSVTMQVSVSSTSPSENSLNGLSSSQFLGTTHIEDFNAQIGLSWEADIWSKIKSQKQAALASYLQTSEARKAVQTRIVATVAQGYYQLLMMDTQMQIAKKNILLSDSTLSMIKLQFDAGQVTSLAIQQAEAQLLVAKQIIPNLEQEIIIQENALRILTGKIPSAIARQITLAGTDVPENLSAGVPTEMLSTRPDVKIAELSLILANAKVGVAKANMYPSLYITAAGGLNSLKASNWFNIPASLFGSVAGGIVQPIFQRRQLKTQYEVEKLNRDKVVLEFRQSVLNAVGEVSDELTRIEKLKDQYFIAQNRTSTLQKAVNNASLLFKNGMATYLEVITAQSNYLQSELDLAALKTARLSATVRLYRSLGGGA
ncbi:multidrug efflux system outer membrane protein [Pedobacter sp. UYP24]